MFKVRGREGGQNIIGLNYFDVSCVKCFLFNEGRMEDRTSSLMFHAWVHLMFKEGGREDRTSWTLNYFDVSCMYYFDVQRGREGGHNIMDFEVL